MSIQYYPGETNKKLMHVIEQQQQPNCLQSVYGAHDMNDGDLSASLWSPKGWEIKRISVHFANSADKNYALSIVRGIGVVGGKNDRLWVKVDTLSSQEIIVPQGFYTTSTLCVALTNALNAKDFPASLKPFSVTYTSGKFNITPASGNARVLATNTATSMRRISTLAPLIGFTTDSAMTTPVVANDTRYGLDGINMPFRYETDSKNVDVMSSDTIAMTVDDQLQITASYAASGSPDWALYEVVYKVLDI